ncbi:hypothetical protein Fot_17155 [Forsythia ovata]|uniref:Uncharacterized protein n=1 Tax=Forsythia ovata TaxID=205694 RepID=A0ABD1VEK1_9LAMI
MSYLTSTKRDTIVQKVLPRHLRFYLNISGPTSISQVLPNPYEEGQYRPRCPTSIYQVLHRYLRSYLTSTKMNTIIQEVLPQYIRSYIDISGPTLISQVTPTK